MDFLSPFLSRAPPPEMRLERRECFPDHAGKGSLLSSYEVETVLLESGREDLDTLEWSGYVRELLELQQGCEGPLEVPEVRCD